MSRRNVPATAPVSPDYRETSFWWDDASFPVHVPDSSLPGNAEVVIVGGGYTGMSAAWDLAKRGRGVLLLEQSALGAGASTRNAGMVHPGVKQSITQLKARYGELGDRLYIETVQAFDLVERVIREEGIECHYEPCGYLYLAHRPSRLEALRAVGEALRPHLDQQVRLLDQDEVAEETGSAVFHGGLLVERAGRLHPAKYLRGLIQLAVEAGATLLPETPVNRLEPLTGNRFLVHTGRGVVRADRVIIATNGYTGALVPALRRGIIPIGSYMIATEPLPEMLASQISKRGRVFFDSRNLLFYWRLSPDGRLLFGGRTSFVPTSIPRARDSLYRAATSILPDLHGVRVDYAWGGTVGFTLDRVPHIGEHEGVLYALGYSGAGIAMATYFGAALASMVEGKHATEFARLRLPVIPLYSGKPWFLPFVGAWLRVRDRMG